MENTPQDQTQRSWEWSLLQTVSVRDPGFFECYVPWRNEVIALCHECQETVSAAYFSISLQLSAHSFLIMLMCVWKQRQKAGNKKYLKMNSGGKSKGFVNSWKVELPPCNEVNAVWEPGNEFCADFVFGIASGE